MTTPHTPPAALPDALSGVALEALAQAIDAHGVQSIDDALVMADAILDDPDGGVEWLMAHGCDVIDRLRAALRAERAQHAAAVASAVAAERERVLQECIAVCVAVADDLDDERDYPEGADGAGECADAIGVLLTRAPADALTAPAATTGGA